VEGLLRVLTPTQVEGDGPRVLRQHVDVALPAVQRDAVFVTPCWASRPRGATVVTQCYSERNAGREHAVALVKERAVRGERSLEFDRVNVYRLHGGKIVELWYYDDDPYALDEFWFYDGRSQELQRTVPSALSIPASFPAYSPDCLEKLS
jgi:hypothetical protein